MKNIDTALGCPLIFPENGDRPYVDWKNVHRELVLMGLLEEEQLKKQN